MQKSLSFRLSAFTLFTGFCIASCTLNPDMQGRGVAYLQGIWQQDSVPHQRQLLNYSLYHFKFSCDSFFIQINSYSKINNGADSCMAAGHWTEYIKGNYQQRNDTLHLKGQFCNADYSLKSEAGCFRSGVYEDLFKIRKQSDSIVQLSSTSSVIPIKAHLIKRIVCNLKPL